MQLLIVFTLFCILFSFLANDHKVVYSKASSYTALSFTDLADACFLIGCKNLNTRIYLAACSFNDLVLILLSNSSCTNLSYTSFIIPPKRASQGLTGLTAKYYHFLLSQLSSNCQANIYHISLYSFRP